MIQILDFCDIINAQIIITYYPNQDRRFCARIKDAEVKEGGCLVGTHGNADTPDGSIADYAKKIAGRTLVLRAYHDNRLEYEVPKNLTHGGAK